MKKYENKHSYFERSRDDFSIFSKTLSCIFVNGNDPVLNYFLSISEQKFQYFESDDGCKTCQLIFNDYQDKGLIYQKNSKCLICEICKDKYNKQNQDSKDSEYCPLCKKYGHYSCTKSCKYCKLCKFFGHTLDECLVHKNFEKLFERKHGNSLIDLLNPKFIGYRNEFESHHEHFGGVEVENFYSIYKCILHEREMLSRLLKKDNTYIKLQSLKVFIKTITGESLAIYKVLTNNDLFRVIVQYLPLICCYK